VSPQRLRIRAGDRDHHAAFFRHAARIFPSIDFRRWAARGGWTDDYEIFALAEGDELIAAIGRTRMDLVMGGRPCIGYQLGAVGTLPAHRGRGHARAVMQWLLDALDTPDQPVILFANDTVLDFYPRFGFRRVVQQSFGAAIDLAPEGRPARALDLGLPADRARLARLCAAAPATGRGFSTRDYHNVLLWHLTYRPFAPFWLDGPEALLVASEVEGMLAIHDLIAARPFDLRGALPQVIGGPISTIAFGFAPEAWWPAATVLGDDHEAPLFVRGGPPLPAGPIRFPDLAQT
jgi:predicted N-acetyltransferase YhbS